MTEERIVGKGVERVDARAKVTGQTIYAGDIRLQGMHFGKIVFSPHPRARVLAIDTSAAGAMPGVRRVITARDLPGTNRYGYEVAHRPVLVSIGEEVRYVGDAVAMVVAETEELASRAASAVSVRYEVLRPLTSPAQAMESGAPLIHEGSPGNRCTHRQFSKGDVESGFRDAEVVVEEIYQTPRQEQAFLETEAGVAYQDQSGVLHVMSCLQDPYGVADDIHIALGVPKSKIHIKGTPVGGGFGGKLNTTIQVHLAAMALLAGVPVMLVLDREESFVFHPKRHPAEIRLRIGAGRDGVIRALEGKVIADAGPYSGRTPEVVGLLMSALVGPYRIPNISTQAEAIYTNNLDSGAFRGFGAPQAAIARECLMDRLARTLAIDPLELRRRNFLKAGDRPASAMLGDSPVSLDTLIERILEKLGPRPSVAEHSRKRIGRSICFDMPVFDVGAIPVLGKSGVGATIEVQSDGSVTVYAGGTELGQGISTVLAQIAAEGLGLTMESVLVEMSDTSTCPRAGRTSASRLSFGLGNALLRAIEPVRKTIAARAAALLEAPPEDLAFEGGRIRTTRAPVRSVPFADVARACSEVGDNLREEGWFRASEGRYMYGHTFMAAAADVEVDPDTGETRVLKIVNVLDMGRILNPVMAYGQLYGGAIQALGYALMEDMTTSDGLPTSPSFAQYMIPTALDVPEEFVSDAIETPYAAGPFGAKGIGEAALNCTTPTLLNAIADALGTEVKAIPIGQEHVLAAARERGLCRDTMEEVVR